MFSSELEMEWIFLLPAFISSVSSGLLSLTADALLAGVGGDMVACVSRGHHCIFQVTLT